MQPFLPPHEFAQLKETIALLLRANYRKECHLFIHPDSLAGLAEDMAEKHHMEVADAKNLLILLTAKQALVMLKDIS